MRATGPPAQGLAPLVRPTALASRARSEGEGGSDTRLGSCNDTDSSVTEEKPAFSVDYRSLYLTMAQEVSEEHVSTAAGLLGGSGSLAGAVAMWAVGKVTLETGSFAIPMIAVAVAGILAAVAGFAVTSSPAQPG